MKTPETVILALTSCSWCPSRLPPHTNSRCLHLHPHPHPHPHLHTHTHTNTQAKKAADAAANSAPSKKAALLDDSSEETDPNLYFENRVKVINAKKAKGLNPYPHKFAVSTSLPDYVAQYKDLEPGSRLDDVTVSVAGGGAMFAGQGGEQEQQ